MDYNITPKHNYKLSEEDKHNIILEYTFNRRKENIKDICKRYDISERTLYNIINNPKYQKQVEKSIKEYSNNFSKKTKVLIDKALNQLNDKINNGEISARDLTILTGTLYDKSRLEDNLSTSNQSFNININIDK
jgi:hypothetical protein